MFVARHSCEDDLPDTCIDRLLSQISSDDVSAFFQLRTLRLAGIQGREYSTEYTEETHPAGAVPRAENACRRVPYRRQRRRALSDLDVGALVGGTLAATCGECRVTEGAVAEERRAKVRGVMRRTPASPRRMRLSCPF